MKFTMEASKIQPTIPAFFVVKKENEMTPEDLNNEFFSDVEIKEETWHVDSENYPATYTSTKTTIRGTQQERAPFFHCNYCNQVITTENSQHINHEHLISISKFKCALCYFRTNNESALRAHVARNHSDQTYECDYCKKMFSEKGNIRTHIINQHSSVPQICPICGTQRKNLQSLQYHYAKQHQGESIKCDWAGCTMSFVRLTNFKHHRVQHSIDWVSVKTTTKRPKLRLRAKENHCDQVTGTEDKPVPHVKSEHLNNMRTFKCLLCDFKTVHQSTFSGHVTRKHGDHKYECDYCKKMFPAKVLAKKHITEQHNSIPVVCTICGAQFKNLPSLKKHYSNLHRYNLMRCNWTGCRRLFIEVGDLESHKAEHLTKRSNAQLLSSIKKSKQKKLKPVLRLAKMNPVVVLKRIEVPWDKKKRSDLLTHRNFEVKQENETVSADLTREVSWNVEIKRPGM